MLSVYGTKSPMPAVVKSVVFCIVRAIAPESTGTSIFTAGPLNVNTPPYEPPLPGLPRMTGVEAGVPMLVGKLVAGTVEG